MNSASEGVGFRIADINWQAREYCDHGVEGVVYRVAHGLVAKVGNVSQNSIETQNLFYQYGMALPVLDFVRNMPLDSPMAREICHKHGYPRNLAVSKHMGCSCNRYSAGALLTWEAQPLSEEERRSKDVRNFRRRLRYRLKKHNLFWDFRNLGNVMCYLGRLIAIDF